MKIVPNQEDLIKSLSDIFERPSLYKKGDLVKKVAKLIQKRKEILDISKKVQTPFYVFDQAGFNSHVSKFTEIFTKYIPDLSIFYAMKLNHHPFFIKEAVRLGLNLDVASIRELKIALKYKPQKIIYFSPGKTIRDLEYIVKTNYDIYINVDSFSELRKLGEITNNLNKKIKVGVRIYIPEHGAWSKYGIKLSDLKSFWETSNKNYPNINLQGIHFHTSRNKTAKNYVTTIKSISRYLKKNFSREELNQIKYIDFGGGFDTSETEGIYPSKTPLGQLFSIIGQVTNKKVKFKDKYYLINAITLEEYALQISSVINKYLRPYINAEYFTEPGRFLCNDYMHIVLSVSDVKNEKNIVVDGGVNLVGWQRFEYEYFPLVNLTRPSLQERKCTVYGNLCTTWDLWGYYIYSDQICEKDTILVPYQGALTYSLAQTFINPIAKVYKL